MSESDDGPGGHRSHGAGTPSASVLSMLNHLRNGHTFPEVSTAPAGLQGLRLLIVDDCAVHRESLAGALGYRHGAAATAVAWDLVSLIAGIEMVQPDVVLLHMKTQGSLSLLRQIKVASPQTPVVVLGISDTDESEVIACAEAGAVGYHLHDESLEDLVLLVERVAAGDVQCSPRISGILLRRLSTLGARHQPATKKLGLTAREIQILRMLDAARSNREIAEDLDIAVHTVKNHVHSLLTKLGVSSREQAGALARSILAPGEGPGDQTGI